MSPEVPEPWFAPPTAPGALPADPHTAAGSGTGTPTTTPAAAGPRRPARRVRVAAGTVAALLVVALAVAGGVALARERAWDALPAALDEARDANAVQLVLGSCLAELPDDGPVGEVRAVPCRSPHGAQVVARYDSAPDAVWPGPEALVALASQGCTTDVLAPAGRRLADELRFVVWTPSEASWDDGDRAGLCLVAGDALVGTLL